MADFLSVSMNLLINGIPIFILIIPMIIIKIFVRNKTVNMLYNRFFAGILVFFLVYYIMPTIFQVGLPVIDTLNLPSNNVDLLTGIGYMLIRTATLIANYFQFPIINFSFIFICAPFISIFFLWVKLRKEDNLSFKKNLAGVTFEITKSPMDSIKERLKKGDLNEEKQLFKLLVVLLPISLYLLTTILKIAEIADIADITKAGGLGWFIEIFFVYLATFLYGIHLLKASNVSSKGRFIGEKLVDDTSSSLITVGVPISILSILLFIVEYLDQLTLVLYFFGYFLMTAFIFVTYLTIIEPFCILILVKIIDAIKYKQKEAVKPEKLEIQQDNTVNYIFPLIFGALGGIIFLVLMFIRTNLWYLVSSGYNITNIIDSVDFSSTQTFDVAVLFEIMQLIDVLAFFTLTFVIGFLLSYSNKNIKRIGVSSLLFVIIFVTISLLFGFNTLLFGELSEWITGKLVTSNVFSVDYIIFTTRTASLDANLGYNLLFYIASPYNYTRYIMAFFYWGIVFYYSGKKFIIKLIKRENLVDQTIFSNLGEIPSGVEFLHNSYLISRNKEREIDNTEQEGTKIMVRLFEDSKSTLEIRKDTLEENKNLYNQLEYLTKKKYLQWWVSEFSFTFERAQMDALYVMYSDGRDVVNYNFSEGESKADPALVSGMFSAITSFIKETTHSSDLLRTIDHGDSKITIEYGKYVFGAIFADMVTTEIRTNLKNFISEFEEKHGEVLENWNGNMDPFKDNDQLVEQIFII